MDYNTIVMLKKDVLIDAENYSTRIYQSIKSLTEYAIKSIFSDLKDEAYQNNNRMDMGQLLMRLKNHYVLDFDIDSFRRDVIRIRNIREHQPEQITKTSIYNEVREIVLYYNDFINSLDKITKIDMRVFLVNEDIFYSRFNISIADHKPSKSLSSKEMEAKFYRESLVKKLSDLEYKYKHANNSSKYLIKSEIIETNNFIHSNDSRLMSVYATSETHRRKLSVQKADAELFIVGVGPKDYGFRVIDLQPDIGLSNPFKSVYAIVWSIFLRSKLYKPSSYISDYERENRVKLNYSNIIRYQAMLLTIIRKNKVNNMLNINLVDGDPRELKVSFEDINNLAKTIASLANIKFQEPELRFAESGIPISIRKNIASSFYCEDNLEEVKNSSYFNWYENDLQYSIDSIDYSNLRLLLKDLFGFEQFKSGQLETIRDLLSNDSSSITIMPTNAGKSLVYYMKSLLSSKPILIVSPTKVLIRDQIRNLREVHNVDNVTFLETMDGYSDYEFNRKINYTTPETFLNHTFTDRIAQLYNNGQIDTVILDEIHCASNWSHDYRPAYLMVGKYLSNHTPYIKVHGFTATISPLMVNDVLKQFNIDKPNIYEHMKFNRDNIAINIKKHRDKEELINHLKSYIRSNDGKKSIVFTKSDNISQNIYGLLDESSRIKCDVFNEYNQSYEEFTRGYTSTLISSSEMGIGINIPDIKRSYHIGYPLSRNHFIQEAGRVARGDFIGESTILVKNKDEIVGVEKKLIEYSTPIEVVIDVVNTLGSSDNSTDDIFEVYKTIFGHVEKPNDCIQNLRKLHNELKSHSGKIKLFRYDVKSSVQYKKIDDTKTQSYLIFLKNMGIVEEWYVDGNDNKGTHYIVVLSRNSNDLSEVKRSTINYLREMNGDDRHILRIKECQGISEIIGEYLEWHYHSYLHYHREQFLNFMSSINNYLDGGSYNIDDQNGIEFALSHRMVEEIRDYVNTLEIAEIIDNNELQTKEGVKHLLEKCIEDRYNVKFDLALLCLEALNNSSNFSDRFNRILHNASSNQREELENNLPKLFSLTDGVNRTIFLNHICNLNKSNFDLDGFYAFKEKDFAYYNILAKSINEKLIGG